jgi:hypothetical protein
MKQDSRNKQVRELVEALLEAEGENDLYNTFIQPFVDVGITAAYGIEKLSTQVQTVVKGFLYGLPTLFVPFLEFDYESFREDEKKKVDDLKKKYGKTLQANLDAITSNDAFGLAFLLAPSTILAAQLAAKVPAAALKILGIFLGDSAIFGDVQKAISGVANVGFHDPGGHSAGAWATQGGGYADDGWVTEAKEAGDSSEILKILKDKKVQAAFQKSPLARQMRQDGVNVIVDHVKRFMSAKSYDELRRLARNDQGFAQIGQALKQLNQSGQVPPQDNPTVAQAMVPKLKETYRDFWVKKMQELASQYPEAQAELQGGIKTLLSMK